MASPPQDPVEKQSKRGRPPKSDVDKLRDRVWLHAVKCHFAVPTGYQMEKMVDGELFQKRDGKISRPRKWDFYLQNADRGPQKIKGKRFAVDDAEQQFPGTARWYYSPIWEALKDKPMSAADCDRALQQLDPTISALLFENFQNSVPPIVRQCAVTEETIATLIAIGSFDALAAAVILVRQSDVISSPPLRDLALKCYVGLQPQIAQLPEMAPYYKQLFLLIDLRCKYWEFISSNQRMEIVIFSEGVNDHVRGPADSESSVADEKEEPDHDAP